MKSDDLLLYAIAGRNGLSDEMLYDRVKKALDGGITCLQLREKNLTHDCFLREALKIQKLCKRYKLPFIINDVVEIAKQIHADGIHVGQRDMNAESARKIVGPDMLIGVSCQTVEQALSAQAQGADYLGVGAIFTTQSKADADRISRQTLTDICKSVNVPVVAIGGITKENLIELKNTGVCGISVISAIFEQPDITEATKELKRRCQIFKK